jgi:hypothetical protein
VLKAAVLNTLVPPRIISIFIDSEIAKESALIWLKDITFDSDNETVSDLVLPNIIAFASTIVISSDLEVE